MNEYLDNVQYSPIRDYPYAEWFREVQYNGKSLSATERKEFVSVADETISGFAEGLPLLKKMLEDNRNKHDDKREAYFVLLSVLQFVTITIIDSIVISKYFILADKDYDRRFMRGKMKVILNEGFKKLYGFNEGKQSKWNDIGTILKFFPEEIHRQYQELSALLDAHSKSSSWWKDERDVETHLDADKLYDSRCEDIEESKVMMESLKLYNTLFAVYAFLSNIHKCIHNTLFEKYKRGELIDE
jgi:hypothetical protein